MEINISSQVFDVRNKYGGKFGEWSYGTQTASILFDSEKDAGFIDLCEPNDDGTYHMKIHINLYAEYVQLCQSYGMWLTNIQTEDNLPDDGLILTDKQMIEFPRIELIHD